MSKKDAIEKAIPYTLRAIYLRESHLRMQENFDPAIPGQALNGQFRSSGGSITCTELTPQNGEGQTIRSCTFVTRFGFRYFRSSAAEASSSESDEKVTPVLELDADIAVDYLVGTPEMPPQEELQHWASTNALLHAWPYWREYCHSTLSRMNMPVSIMPMLNVQAPPTAAEVTTAKKVPDKAIKKASAKPIRRRGSAMAR